MVETTELKYRLPATNPPPLLLVLGSVLLLPKYWLLKLLYVARVSVADVEADVALLAEAVALLFALEALTAAAAAEAVAEVAEPKIPST
jgi:hypothetical protein